MHVTLPWCLSNKVSIVVVRTEKLVIQVLDFYFRHYDAARRAINFARACRFLLRVINLILAVIGFAMVFYAIYMYLDIKRHSSLRGFPWWVSPLQFTKFGSLL